MALTRRERNTIEILIKKVRALENNVNSLEQRVTATQKMLDGITSLGNILDWPSNQVEEWLKPYFLKFMLTNNPVLPRHNHINNQQGGDCFAKLGANLME